MLRFFIGLSLVWAAVPTILSDTGCHCALQKNTNSTPTASSAIVVGCSYKMDWNGSPSKWCLTDQTNGSCGVNQTGFGVVDSCAIAGFTSVMLTPALQLTWYQSNSTYFTGQNLTVNWTSQNILSDEPIKISYLRTTLTSLGNNAQEFYTGRISDSVNSLASNTFIILSATTSPAVTTNGSQLFSIIQSSATGAQVINNGTIVTTGTSVMILGQNLTVNWTGVGQASLGVATVTIKSSFGGGGGGGGGTTVGTPVSNIPVQTNNTIIYLLPRSFVPGFGGTQYSATISIVSPGAITPYTTTSSSFSHVAAPTNTASATNTRTATPTPSVSFGSSQSSTPSVTPTISSTGTQTPTPTSSQTPTPSLSFGATPSTTSPPSPSGSPSVSMTSSISSSLTSTASPTPPVDVGAIAAAATQAASANLAAILGGVLGSIVGITLLSIVGYRYHQRQVLIQKRKRATVVTQRLAEASRLYGVHIDNPGVLPIDRAYRPGRLPRQNSRNRNGS